MGSRRQNYAGSRKKAHEPALVRFAREFGWRAYAIPVLAVITVWILVDVLQSPAGTEEAAPSTTQQQVTSVSSETGAKGPDPASVSKPQLPVGELPPGGEFTRTGANTFRTAGKAGAKVGEGKEQTYTYVVEIENGLNTVPYGGDAAVAEMIDATLGNPKGWIADPAFAFQHVNPDQNPKLRIQLASLDTTHKYCGHELEMETSCFTSDGDRVILNESRWVRGAITSQGDQGSYRQYLINHEVGHGLGYAAHQACADDGHLAPVMMQQTLSLNNSELHKLDPNEVYPADNKQCVFNPWPYPYGKN